MENQNPLPPETPGTPKEPNLFGSKAADIILGVLASIFGPPIIVIAASPIHPVAGIVAMGCVLVAFVAWKIRNPRVAVFFKTCVAVWGICLVVIPLIVIGTCGGRL